MHYINYIEIFIELSYHFLICTDSPSMYLVLVIKILRVCRGLGLTIMSTWIEVSSQPQLWLKPLERQVLGPVFLALPTAFSTNELAPPTIFIFVQLYKLIHDTMSSYVVHCISWQLTSYYKSRKCRELFQLWPCSFLKVLAKILGQQRATHGLSFKGHYIEHPHSIDSLLKKIMKEYLNGKEK